MDFIVCLLIGSVLLFSGAMKTLDSRRFIRHIERYGLVHKDTVPKYTIAFIALECTFGAAFLLHLSPYLYPAGVLLFTGFLVLTLWGASVKGVEDCGCYGNQVDLSPRQSAMLDAIYVIMLIAAWWTAPAWTPTLLSFRVAAALIVGAIAAVLAYYSSKKPLIDLLRIRAGARWKDEWLEDPEPGIKSGTHFVVFLSSHCPACKKWVPLLNVLDSRPDLPAITGIVNMTREEVQDFALQHTIRFPLARMRASLLQQMVDAYPTAAMIVDGVVQRKWIGEFPPELSSRLDAFYRVFTPLSERMKPMREARPGRFGG